MISLMHVQIVIEVVFFAAILLLLWRMKRDVEKYRPLADASVTEFLKRSMAESQEFAEKFVTQMEENKQALILLARQLSDKETKLTELIARAEATIEQMKAGRSESGPVSQEKRYDDAIRLIRKGMNREEVSKLSGLTEGEISLIMELARTRNGPSS